MLAGTAKAVDAELVNRAESANQLDENQPGRRFPRFVVHLAVRYTSALEYVRQYADSLSQGGLFVSGAHDLEPLQEVDVEMELPGHGVYALRTRVAYVVDIAQARARAVAAGAGLAIVSAPAGFEARLKRYLMVLGRRKDVMVLVVDDSVRRWLQEAGFAIAHAPPPERAAVAVLDTKRVIALVVPEATAADYRDALGAQDLPPELVVVVQGLEAKDEVLQVLDRRVLALTHV